MIPFVHAAAAEAIVVIAILVMVALMMEANP